MKNLVCLLLCANLLQAQSIRHCKQRFDQFLNFHGSLNGQVKFEENALYLMSGGKKQFAVFQDELAVLGKFFEYTNLERQSDLVRHKGIHHYSASQLDSLDKAINNDKSVIRQPDSLNLRGYRIALDPGHFGTTMLDAKAEQKFLYFVRSETKDTINLFESSLTFNTATMLKAMLEAHGAAVFLTRSRADYTSFECTYQDFLKLHRRHTLDSLVATGQMSPSKRAHLLSCNDYAFFWDFFRDYDLANRAAKINRYDPHVTAIIHYNVDEKNAPWKNYSHKNFTMAFVPGAFTAGDLTKPESRVHFIRLLITNQQNRSVKLATTTVENFAQDLELPIARSSDATYLAENCMATNSPGVFCRNLVLCRKINSPLVYGESLYQDNMNECADLMRCDVDAYGIRTSSRLVKVAGAYYKSLLTYLTY